MRIEQHLIGIYAIGNISREGTIEKGALNERHGFKLATQLVGKRIFTRIEKPTKKQRRLGINFLGVALLDPSIPLEEVKIPFDITSSVKTADAIWARNINDPKRRRTVIVVVNPWLTDGQIKDYFTMSAVRYIRERQTERQYA